MSEYFEKCMDILKEMKRVEAECGYMFSKDSGVDLREFPFYTPDGMAGLKESRKHYLAAVVSLFWKKSKLNEITEEERECFVDSLIEEDKLPLTNYIQV